MSRWDKLAASAAYTFEYVPEYGGYCQVAKEVRTNKGVEGEETSGITVKAEKNWASVVGRREDKAPTQGEIVEGKEHGAVSPTAAAEETMPPKQGEVGEGAAPMMLPARGEVGEGTAAWAGEGEAVVEATMELAESEDTEPKEEKELVTGAADDAAADADRTKKIKELEGGKVVMIDGEKLVFNEVLLIYEDEDERKLVDVKRGRGGKRPAAIDNGASSSKVSVE